jgi:hypothetical protein
MTSRHIPGEKNGEADACSRPEKFPSLDCAIEQFSQLQTCQAFLLPYGLLSMIATLIPDVMAHSIGDLDTIVTNESDLRHGSGHANSSLSTATPPSPHSRVRNPYGGHHHNSNNNRGSGSGDVPSVRPIAEDSDVYFD